jgi:hypothetical protein
MIFISHSSKDHKVATTICRGLENRGVACWISSRDVEPGGNYQESIDQAIRTARAMVLVFTGSANDSAEIKKELALASSYKIVVIPVRAEDVVPTGAFKYELVTRQWVDLFDDWEQALERLVEQINRIAEPGQAANMPATGTATTKAALHGRGTKRPAGLLIGGGMAALCVLGALVAYFVASHGGDQAGPSQAAKPGAATGQAVAQAVPALRNAAASLSNAQIDAMLTKFDFYDKARNAGGKGIPHRYEPQAIGEATLVLDRATGLMWQKAGSDEAMPLADADAYIKRLNAQKFAGFADWRLPTLEEAMTLMEPKASDKMYIAPQFKRGINFIWTADHGTDASSGFVLYFFDGTLSRESAQFNAWVRAVRNVSQA